MWASLNIGHPQFQWIIISLYICMIIYIYTYILIIIMIIIVMIISLNDHLGVSIPNVQTNLSNAILLLAIWGWSHLYLWSVVALVQEPTDALRFLRLFAKLCEADVWCLDMKFITQWAHGYWSYMILYDLMILWVSLKIGYHRVPKNPMVDSYIPHL